MKRLHGWAFGLLLLGICGSAGACMNDRELPQHEREFRSQYGEMLAEAPALLKPWDYSGSQAAMVGSGLFFLAGAVGLAVQQGRSRAED